MSASAWHALHAPHTAAHGHTARASQQRMGALNAPCSWAYGRAAHGLAAGHGRTWALVFALTSWTSRLLVLSTCWAPAALQAGHTGSREQVQCAQCCGQQGQRRYRQDTQAAGSRCGVRSAASSRGSGAAGSTHRQQSWRQQRLHTTDGCLRSLAFSKSYGGTAPAGKQPCAHSPSGQGLLEWLLRDHSRHTCAQIPVRAPTQACAHTCTDKCAHTGTAPAHSVTRTCTAPPRTLPRTAVRSCPPWLSPRRAPRPAAR